MNIPKYIILFILISHILLLQTDIISEKDL